MSTVVPRPNESIDSLLRRFKKAVDRSGVLSDLRKHEFYEKPSVRRKRKQAAARKRALKKQKKTEQSARPRNQNFRWNNDRTAKIPLKAKPRPQNNSTRDNNKHTNSNFKKKFHKPHNYNNKQGKPK